MTLHLNRSASTIQDQRLENVFQSIPTFPRHEHLKKRPRKSGRDGQRSQFLMTLPTIAVKMTRH